jgi:hypothetical protein
MMVTTLADARLWRERDVSWLDDNDSPAEKGLRNAVIVATRPSGPDMDLNRLSRSRVSFCCRMRESPSANLQHRNMSTSSKPVSFMRAYEPT